MFNGFKTCFDNVYEQVFQTLWHILPMIVYHILIETITNHIVINQTLCLIKHLMLVVKQQHMLMGFKQE